MTARHRHPSPRPGWVRSVGWGLLTLTLIGLWGWILTAAVRALIDAVTFTGLLRLLIEAIAAAVTVSWSGSRALGRPHHDVPPATADRDHTGPATG